MKLAPIALLRLIIIFGFLLSPAAVAKAQSAIQVTDNKMHITYPNALRFQVKAQSTSPIKEVTLIYGANGRSCEAGNARQVVEITGGTQVTAEWTWDLKRSGTLPHGEQVWWQWEITDAAGSKTTTPKQTSTITDDRYTWQQIRTQNVTLYWVKGNQTFGQSLVNIASASLDRVAKEIGVQTNEEIQIVIYPDYDALRGALLFAPDWTGGVAYPRYNITVLGIAPELLNWAQQSIPHELTHLIVGSKVFNCRGTGLPTWLNEGIAEYLSNSALGRDNTKLLFAISQGQIGSLRSLANGFQSSGNLANLSYEYSGQVARYLIKTYGPDKMRALLTEVQSGQPIDPALKTVYGFDTEGLDAAWRKTMGITVIATSAAPTPTRTTVPTFVLYNPFTTTGTPIAALTQTPSPQTVATKTPLPVAATPTPSNINPDLSDWLVPCLSVVACLIFFAVAAGTVALIVNRRK